MEIAINEAIGDAPLERSRQFVDDPNFLDPLVTQLAQVRQTMTSVYDTLTYLDAADPTFPIKGRLAKEWTFTQPTTFDMMLHEGVTFHGGEDFSAEDVKWTIDYVLNPETKSPNATFLSQVDSVEVLDPLTIRFNLNRPWADDSPSVQDFFVKGEPPVTCWRPLSRSVIT